MKKSAISVATLPFIIGALCVQTVRRSSMEFMGEQPPSKDPAIRIIRASFGDQLAQKTCTPDLSICKNTAARKFTVGDMCTVDSQVKNLEVTWDCGEGTPKKSRAAAKDTEISLVCGK